MTRMSDIPPEILDEMTPAVRAFVESLLAMHAAQTAALEKRIAELEARLGTNSRNSSQPPSTEHPHAGPKPKNGKSRRRRGGQQGHQKRERPLIPTEECDDVIPCRPTGCRQCGNPLDGTDAEPLRQQVWDIEIRRVVTEYQQHRLTCSCGTTTCGALPDQVDGRTGPVLAGLLVLMTSWFRASRRKAAQFASDVCGVPCSAGHVSQLEAKATSRLRPAYDELVESLPEQANLKVDETPFRRGREKTWLWTYVAKMFTVFVLAGSRKAKELTATLGGEFEKPIHCDRAKMYWQYPKLQWCWAHLKRDFQKLIDSNDRQLQRLGHDLMRPTNTLFTEHVRYRDGTITFATLQRNLQPVRQTVEGLLLRGHGTAAHGMCRELYDHREHLWTFLSDSDVEPTNNAAERSLRHGVIWRRLSFGTQSHRGDRFVETMLSIIETCRQQNQNVLSYVTDAMKSNTARSLLSTTP